MSHPVTMLVTRRISPQRYGDFLAWMRQGEILAAGFPGFLGSGVLQPPEGATSTRSCCASRTRPA